MAIEEKKFLGTAAVERLIANTREEIAAGDQATLEAAKQHAVWLSKPCVSLKYCGLCPHPQPLKKVDQIFIFEYKICNNSNKISRP